MSAFLVSASRSGSTMMSEILKLHPEILSISELMVTQGARALLPGKISGQAFWRQLSKPTGVMRQLANPEASPKEFLYQGGRFDRFRCPPLLAVTLPHLFDQPDDAYARLEAHVPDFPRQTRPDHYRALFAKLSEQTGRKFWVERSGGSLLATSALAEAFPEAKFIVLMRNEEDTARSMQNYKPTRFMIWVWKRARALGLDIMRPDASFGRSRSMALAEKLGGALPMKRIMAQEPAFEDCLEFCRALSASGLSQVDRLEPTRVRFVHYEQMLETPREELCRLVEFLDLSPDESWLNVAAKIPVNPRAKTVR